MSCLLMFQPLQQPDNVVQLILGGKIYLQPFFAAAMLDAHRSPQQHLQLVLCLPVKNILCFRHRLLCRFLCRIQAVRMLLQLLHQLLCLAGRKLIGYDKLRRLVLQGGIL